MARKKPKIDSKEPETSTAETDSTGQTPEAQEEPVAQAEPAGPIDINAWQFRPVSDLPIPAATVRFIVERALKPNGELIVNLGDVAAALDADHDIGLGPLAERARAFIDDLKAEDAKAKNHEQPAAPEADGVATDQATNETVAENGSVSGERVTPNGILPDPKEALEKIQAAEKDCEDARSILSDAAAEHKAAKKIWEGTVAKLTEIIRWARTPQQPTLFDGVKRPDGTAPNTPRVATAEEVENAWRQYPLKRWDQFDLSESLITLLGENGINTVGELSDYQKPNDQGYQKTLTQIKGIGKGKVERIEDANAKFWWYWNDKGKFEFSKEIGLVIPEATTADDDDDGDGIDESDLEGE